MLRSFRQFLTFVLLSTIFLAPAVSAAAQASWRVRLSQGDGYGTDDVAEEIRFGREVAARIFGRHGMFDNQEVTTYVNLVGLSVAQQTNRPELAFRFAVLNTDEINAYAAPGGYIFVTRGALLKMQDEAELAGVLAHEIHHVTGRHIVRELNIQGADGAAAAGLARLIGGSTDAARAAFSQAVDQAIEILFRNGYKREDEVQADRTAVLSAALAGYDPGALARYLERIGGIKEKATDVLAKTHPASGDRIAWIRAALQQEGMDPAQFKAGKDRFSTLQKKIK